LVSLHTPKQSCRIPDVGNCLHVSRFTGISIAIFMFLEILSRWEVGVDILLHNCLTKHLPVRWVDIRRTSVVPLDLRI
jgi:hypothetical protein